jgi:hypothetical protein
MTVDRHTLLFLDTSTLIDAAGSLAGGPGFLFSLCGQHRFETGAWDVDAGGRSTRKPRLTYIDIWRITPGFGQAGFLD